MGDEFSNNLLRMATAELHILNLQMAAREMFGRGYFSLSETERQAIVNTVWMASKGMYDWLTPEALQPPEGTQQPPGFVPPSVRPIDGKS